MNTAKTLSSPRYVSICRSSYEQPVLSALKNSSIHPPSSIIVDDREHLLLGGDRLGRQQDPLDRFFASRWMGLPHPERR